MTKNVSRLSRTDSDRLTSEVALDIFREALDRGVAVCRIFLQGASDDRVQVTSKPALTRRVRHHRAGRERLLFGKNHEQLFETRVPIREAMRFASGKYFVKQDTERVDISRLGHSLASGLLR